MSYLEDLKKLISDTFNKEGVVKTKEDVDAYASMTKCIDNAIGENNKLLEANAELSKQYSELCLHTTIGGTPNKDELAVSAVKTAPSMEELIKKFES